MLVPNREASPLKQLVVPDASHFRLLAGRGLRAHACSPVSSWNVEVSCGKSEARFFDRKRVGITHLRTRELFVSGSTALLMAATSKSASWAGG